MPLLSHREAEARDTSAQVLAAVLLAAEAQSSQGSGSGNGGGSSSSSSSSAAAAQLLPNLSRTNAKAHARVSHFLDEGRHRGDHLPAPTPAAVAAFVAANAAPANGSSIRRPMAPSGNQSRGEGGAVAVGSRLYEEEVKKGAESESVPTSSRHSPRPSDPSPRPADSAVLQKLMQMWGPIELVLRQPPKSTAALDRLATSAAAGTLVHGLCV